MGRFVEGGHEHPRDPRILVGKGDCGCFRLRRSSSPPDPISSSASLPRHAQHGCNSNREQPAHAEQVRIWRASSDRAYPWNGRKPAAHLIGAMPVQDAAFQRFDLSTESLKLLS